MSSTEQGKRARKQSAAAARAVAAARAERNNTRKNVIAVVVVVVIAAAIFGGVFYQKQQTAAAAASVIPALTVAGSAQYPVVLDKASATVLAGKPTAATTIDAYEDFLCPICGEFESANFPAMEKQLEAGTIKVRYHMINLLDDRSVPAGYSTMAANTALAVATAAPDKFVDFHDSLFSKQPEENGPGWTQEQLTNLASRLGVSGPAFDAVVTGGTFNAQIQANLTAAENNPALQQQSGSGSGFGTPTIVADGKLVDWQGDPAWLSKLVPGGS